MIKDILIKDFDNFRNRVVLYHTEDDMPSNRLFLMGKTKRNNLSPTFTSGKMKVMLHTVLDMSNQLVAYMNKQDEVVHIE